MSAAERRTHRVCLALYIVGTMLFADTFGLLLAAPWGAGAFFLAVAVCR